MADGFDVVGEEIGRVDSQAKRNGERRRIQETKVGRKEIETIGTRREKKRRREREREREKD